MQWITIGTPPFATLEEFERVTAEINHEPEGLLARWIGTEDGRLRVVGVWESKAHADAFFTGKVGPLLARVLGPEPAGRPAMVGIEVARSYVRQPVG
jgi:hypothetical protein